MTQAEAAPQPRQEPHREHRPREREQHQPPRPAAAKPARPALEDRPLNQLPAFLLRPVKLPEKTEKKTAPGRSSREPSETEA